MAAWSTQCSAFQEFKTAENDSVALVGGIFY